jgi:hypothetical protein
MYLWENRPARADDVVFKRNLCSWVVPRDIAMKVLKYNPRHVPAVQYSVITFNNIGGTYVHIWEHTRLDYDYDRRVACYFSGYSSS